jgi:predicted transcriptional regulator
MENQFGDALREKRRVAGVSQRELADRVNVDFSYISKVETDCLRLQQIKLWRFAWF